jgi:N-acetylglutamate synthase-like GNAT family acetyltransferase
VETITIKSYRPEYQEKINQMMAGIALEFGQAISSPQSAVISEVYYLPGHHFWVAMHNNRVVGTIGVVLFSNGNAVIKRMMVDKEFRGSHYNTAQLLLDKSIEWSKHHSVHTIYLGTMDQFKEAAQRFYEKKGFIEITKAELPPDYESNPIDTVYYKLLLQ